MTTAPTQASTIDVLKGAIAQVPALVVLCWLVYQGLATVDHHERLLVDQLEANRQTIEKNTAVMGAVVERLRDESD